MTLLLYEDTQIPSISASTKVTPPQWALQEQQLFRTLNQAAQEFVARYTRPDGTLIWFEHWPGMDGSDDPYEGFMNLALLYVLGGSDELYDLSRKIWDGITWQWTEYGQIHREFDAYYDWMHHGEGYLYLYFLGLAGPSTLKDRQRAISFAGMYTGEDSEAQNYDVELKLMRSPLNGSRGPKFEVDEEDWSTHRVVLDHYLAPYEDIPGVQFDSLTCPWSDDEVYKQIIAMMNERMNRGDVPLNLNATGLIAHAYLHTGNEQFISWMTDYIEAWEERTRSNGGIIPDNIGLTGAIGEYNDGKWWGGYYGWRWPHGFMTILEPLINACMNRALLTRDLSGLQFARQQIDTNWELGQEEDGKWVVPYKHFDSGWADYREAEPKYPIYLWTMSMADEDLARIARIPRSYDWNEVQYPKAVKHYISNTLSWFQYIRGENPDYPTRILDINYTFIGKQLERIRSVEGDPYQWKVHYDDAIHIWQQISPLYFEGLVQLTLGGPMHIPHGGLQHGRVRYFNATAKRPGLPAGISALVEKLSANSMTLHLVNTSLFDDQELIVQAGVFGEHHFEQGESLDQLGQVTSTFEVNGKWLHVGLPAGTGISLRLAMKRYVYDPTYDMPWQNHHHRGTIRGRYQQAEAESGE